MKRVLALILAFIICFAVVACGSKDADEESSVDTKTDAPAAGETVEKGTRSNPYQLGEPISFRSYYWGKNGADITIELDTIKFGEEIYADYPNYDLDWYCALIGKMTVSNAETDDAFDRAITFSFLTEQFNEFQAALRSYIPGDLNSMIFKLYNDAEYDILISPSRDYTGDPYRYIVVNYRDENSELASVWVELPEQEESAAETDDAQEEAYEPAPVECDPWEQPAKEELAAFLKDKIGEFTEFLNVDALSSDLGSCNSAASAAKTAACAQWRYDVLAWSYGALNFDLAQYGITNNELAPILAECGELAEKFRICFCCITMRTVQQMMNSML